MGRSARARLHRATRHAHSWNAPARRERILLKFFPGANSRAENKKAGQNFYRSDLLSAWSRGPDLNRWPSGCKSSADHLATSFFRHFSVYLGSLRQELFDTLSPFSPRCLAGGHFSPSIPMARKPLLALTFYGYNASDRNDGHRQPEIMASRRPHPPRFIGVHRYTGMPIRFKPRNFLPRMRHEARRSSDKAMTELRQAPTKL